jgi:hypothetical protein
MEFDDYNQIIKLNVGGKLFSTTVKTLIGIPGSFFDNMMRLENDGTKNYYLQSDGTIFIDRSPLVFEFILNYLRGITIDLSCLSEVEKKALLEEASFYNLQDLYESIDNKLNCRKIDSNILSREEANQIFSWFPNKKEINLLYRGSRDGYTSCRFHEMCDNKINTISIIKDIHGCIFGGYSPLSWDCNEKEQYDPKTFLFYSSNRKFYRLNHTTIESNNRRLLEITNIHKNTNCTEVHSIYGDKKFGPFFGCVDLCISDKCNLNFNSDSDSIHFEMPLTKSGYLCDEGKNFQVSEIEVFQIVFK